MAIKSSKSMTADERPISPKEQASESGYQYSLRPKNLAEYIGQEHIKKHLSVSIESAKIRNTALEHILFYGPPGLGKTTLSTLISSEMGAAIKSTSGPAVEKQSDLVSILTSMMEGEILFIDEIHRLKPQIEEILYSAMEDFQIDIMVGSGTGSTSIKMDIPRFTLIGATTRLSSLSHPLRDRFGNVLKLEFYTEEELAHIIKRSFEILDMKDLPDVAMHSIASRSRGTPRIANRYVKIIRDYATVGKKIQSETDCENIFKSFGVDKYGLDRLDQTLLSHLYQSGIGNPLGLSTLASLIGEEVSTIEDVVEPYLLQIGFIERSPRGRKITKKGERYIEGRN